MPKGVLSDEYGVTPDQCRWIVGRIDFPMSLSTSCRTRIQPM